MRSSRTDVWHAKAEELLKVHRFHTLVVRAVSKLDRLLTMFAPTWFAFDRILTIKGASWVEERGEARHFGRLKNLALRKVADYTNPGIERQSVILQVCRKNRLAEIEQRAKDLAAGLPIQDRAEVVAVETESGSARQTGGPRPSRREGPRRHDHGRPDRRKFQGPGGSARRPDGRNRTGRGVIRNRKESTPSYFFRRSLYDTRRSFHRCPVYPVPLSAGILR